METKIEKLEGNVVKVDITVPAKDAVAYYNNAAKRLAQYVNIPGFRKGKAPRNVLEQHIGEERIKHEALEGALPKLFSDVVRENELDVVAQPYVESYDYKIGEDLKEFIPEEISKYNQYYAGSGGLFGVGLGNSSQSSILPEASNDMIFCILCEQLGIFGAAMMLLLYGYLLYQILLVTIKAKTLFGRYLCAGTMFFFAFQTMVNIAVVTGVIPNTGVTLPFLSSGGSALLIAFAQIGLVLSVYKHDVLDTKKDSGI